MPKNTQGGKKFKSIANKNNHQSDGLKKAEHPDEIYGCVIKNNGNTCHVKSITGETLLCYPRKFGKVSKADRINTGSWVLVGLREFGQLSNKKERVCDMIEVYTAKEKDLLKSYVKLPWDNLNIDNNNSSNIDEMDDIIEFSKHKAEQQEALKQLQMDNQNNTQIQSNSTILLNGDINFDDI